MIEVRVPDEQEGTKAVVRAWLKQIGDAVAENDPLVELETDKVTQEVPAPGAGVLAEIVLDTDAEAVPGALLARIETDATVAPAVRPEPVEGPSLPSEDTKQGFDKLSPNGGGENSPVAFRPPRLFAARDRCRENSGHRPQRPGHSRGRRPGGRLGEFDRRSAGEGLDARHPA